MGKLPWMKFFPSDYLLDTQPLSLATRGLWMDVICFLWRAEPRGQLTYSVEQWTKLLRCDQVTWEKGCCELMQFQICTVVTHDVTHVCNADVTQCNKNVTIMSRRMVRAEKLKNDTRLRVKRFRSNADVTKMYAGEVRSQKSEVRSQKSEEEKKEKEKNPPVSPQNKGGLEFQTFWESYPRKTGKKAARRQWDLAKDRPLIEEILTVLERLKNSEQWQKDGGQYIPLPATWLHQGRWDDHPLPNVQKKTKTQEWMEDFMKGGRP